MSTKKRKSRNVKKRKKTTFFKYCPRGGWTIFEKRRKNDKREKTVVSDLGSNQRFFSFFHRFLVDIFRIWAMLGQNFHCYNLEPIVKKVRYTKDLPLY